MKKFNLKKEKILKLIFQMLACLVLILNLPLSIGYVIYGFGYLSSATFLPGIIGVIILIIINLPFILFLFTLTTNFQRKKESTKKDYYLTFLIMTLFLIIIEIYCVLIGEVGLPSG